MTLLPLQKFRYRSNGETCVIIANGPSLKLRDLKKLSKYTTFGSNKIYRLPFTPTYYCIIDREMMQTCLPLPNNFSPKETFIRAECGLASNNPIYPINAMGFSLDINNFIIMGGTVTFAMMQIAYYMGFDNFLLIGLDHYYPKSGLGSPGSGFIAEGEDPDHFICEDGKPYFDEGKYFNRPETDKIVPYYKMFKDLCDSNGKRVINITEGTHLDIFNKGKVEEWE
jgi:hypothetical protein